jgi:hypothetical protein
MVRATKTRPARVADPVPTRMKKLLQDSRYVSAGGTSAG